MQPVGMISTPSGPPGTTIGSGPGRVVGKSAHPWPSELVTAGAALSVGHATQGSPRPQSPFRVVHATVAPLGRSASPALGDRSPSPGAAFRQPPSPGHRNHAVSSATVAPPNRSASPALGDQSPSPGTALRQLLSPGHRNHAVSTGHSSPPHVISVRSAPSWQPPDVASVLSAAPSAGNPSWKQRPQPLGSLPSDVGAALPRVAQTPAQAYRGAGSWQPPGTASPATSERAPPHSNRHSSPGAVVQDGPRLSRGIVGRACLSSTPSAHLVVPPSIPARGNAGLHAGLSTSVAPPQSPHAGHHAEHRPSAAGLVGPPPAQSLVSSSHLSGGSFGHGAFIQRSPHIAEVPATCSGQGDLSSIHNQSPLHVPGRGFGFDTDPHKEELLEHCRDTAKLVNQLASVLKGLESDVDSLRRENNSLRNTMPDALPVPACSSTVDSVSGMVSTCLGPSSSSGFLGLGSAPASASAATDAAAPSTSEGVASAGMVVHSDGHTSTEVASFVPSTVASVVPSAGSAKMSDGRAGSASGGFLVEGAASGCGYQQPAAVERPPSARGRAGTGGAAQPTRSAPAHSHAQPARQSTPLTSRLRSGEQALSVAGDMPLDVPHDVISTHAAASQDSQRGAVHKATSFPARRDAHHMQASSPYFSRQPAMIVVESQPKPRTASPRTSKLAPGTGRSHESTVTVMSTATQRDVKASQSLSERGANFWSLEQTLWLGTEVCAESIAEQVRILEPAAVSSVAQAVDGLNRSSPPCCEAMCAVFSASDRGYYLLYRQGHQEQANACAQALRMLCAAHSHEHTTQHALDTTAASGTQTLAETADQSQPLLFSAEHAPVPNVIANAEVPRKPQALQVPPSGGVSAASGLVAVPPSAGSRPMGLPPRPPADCERVFEAGATSGPSMMSESGRDLLLQMEECAAAGDASRAEELLWLSVRSGSALSETCFDLVIGMFAEKGDQAKAEEWFWRAIEAAAVPSEASFNAIVRGACSRGASTVVEEAMLQMMRLRIRPHKDMFDSVIRLFADMRQAAKVEEWLLNAGQSGWTPEQGAFEAVVVLYAEAQLSVKAEEWLSRALQTVYRLPDACFAAVVEALLRSGSSAGKANEWLARMLAEGRSPDEALLAQVAAQLIEIGDLAHAEERLLQLPTSYPADGLRRSFFRHGPACRRPRSSRGAVASAVRWRHGSSLCHARGVGVRRAGGACARPCCL